MPEVFTVHVSTLQATMDGGINRHHPLHYVTNNYLEPWHRGKLHTTQLTAIYIHILFLLHCLFASASLAGFSSTISAPVRQKKHKTMFRIPICEISRV